MALNDWTWNPGDLVTALLLNGNIRNNFRFAAGSTHPHCRVYRSTDQTLTTATATAILFDTERADVGGMHSTSTNTSRLTVPSDAAGWWQVGGCIEFAANASGYRWLQIRVNGSASPIVSVRQESPDGAVDTILTASTLWPASAGDYFELFAYQTSGGNLNAMHVANYSCEMWADWRST